MKSPVDKLRGWLRIHGIPWSVTASDGQGQRKKGSEWVVYNKYLTEFEVVARECRQEREAALKNLRVHWDDMIAQQRFDLGTLFDEELFPTADWVVGKYLWEIEITPLYDIEGVEKRLFLSLPREWAEEQVKAARRMETMRISNAIASAASEVVDFVGETVKKLSDYNPKDGVKPCPKCITKTKTVPDADCKKCKGTGEVKDGRVKNVFRDKTLFDNVPKLTQRMREMHDMLGDDALQASIDALVEVEKLLNQTSGEEIRASKPKRREVSKKLREVQKAVAPATDRLSEMMG
jgi:hypothetical protein